MKSTSPSPSSPALPQNPAAARPARSRQRGDGGVIAILFLAGLAVSGVVGYFAGHKTSGKPTAEGKEVAHLQDKLDATAAKVGQENAAQIKVGQQLAAATTAALAAAGPEAKADPAVQLAGKTAARADNALALGAGALTPEQVEWVARLVADATAPEVARRAAAEAALQGKSADLQQSVEREGKLAARIETLTGEKRTADQKLIEHDASASAYRATVRLWLFVIVGGWVFVSFVLPLLVKSFPALGGIATAAHAVVGGLWAKTLAETKALARDASGALHNVLKVGADSAAAKAMQAEAAQWITPADGTDTRYQQALKDANVL